MSLIIGIDEAGIGPWAGPLVIGLVVMDDQINIKGVRDSKKLNDKMREELADPILSKAEFTTVEFSSSEDIDEHGIYVCWDKLVMEAIRKARTHFPGTKVIIDGNRCLPGLRNYESCVKADDLIHCVSAASILAKYNQCLSMDTQHRLYPQYGFDQHRGYGTPQHKEALKRYGACPIHRRSYKPLRALLCSPR